MDSLTCYLGETCSDTIVKFTLPDCDDYVVASGYYTMISDGSTDLSLKYSQFEGVEDSLSLDVEEAITISEIFTDSEDKGQYYVEISYVVEQDGYPFILETHAFTLSIKDKCEENIDITEPTLDI